MEMMNLALSNQFFYDLYMQDHTHWIAISIILTCFIYLLLSFLGRRHSTLVAYFFSDYSLHVSGKNHATSRIFGSVLMKKNHV
jgi:hypothetical protein